MDVRASGFSLKNLGTRGSREIEVIAKEAFEVQGTSFLNIRKI